MSKKYIFDSGSPLCSEIRKKTGALSLDTRGGKFPAGEHIVTLANNTPDVKHCKVFVPMEFGDGEVMDSIILRTFLWCKTFSRLGADVVLVAPFLPYGRQDRLIEGDIYPGYTAHDLTLGFADFFDSASLHSVVTVAPHSKTWDESFCRSRVHTISLEDVVLEILISNSKSGGLSDYVMVAADEGARDAAEAVAKKLGCTSAYINKKRTGVGTSEVLSIVGDIGNKDCIIIDDMIDSGNTIAGAIEALQQTAFAGNHSPPFIGTVVAHPVFLLRSDDVFTAVIRDTIKTWLLAYLMSDISLIYFSNSIAGNRYEKVFEAREAFQSTSINGLIADLLHREF